MLTVLVLPYHDAIRLVPLAGWATLDLVSDFVRQSMHAGLLVTTSQIRQAVHLRASAIAKEGQDSGVHSFASEF